MAKRKVYRRKTFSEKVMLVLSVIIALSMVAALVASLAPGRSAGQIHPSTFVPVMIQFLGLI